MSTIRGITVQIGADTSGLQAALRDVNTASSKLYRELRDVEKALKFNPHDTELLAQKQKLLADQVENTSKKLATLKDVQEQVNQQFKDGEISEAQHRAFQREIIETESRLKHYEKQLRAANFENSEFKQSMDKIAKSLNEAGKKMSDIGSNLSKKLTVPLAGIGALAAKIGMDFESAMSQVQAYSGATAQEMEQLEKSARDAGAATSKSAKEAADALGYMALAGWDTQTSIEGLMPVLRLSEAGNIDLARASSLVTDSMSALGVQVQDLEGYLDIVAQTARNSNTNIDQMAEAYIKVGGTLRGLRVPIDESAVALGMLANAGIKGSEAGAGLNAILLNLTAPAGRAKEALEGLGYSAFDAEGNFKGLDQVLFDLKNMTAGMSEEQRNLTLAMIGGKNHTKDLNALLNGLDDSYADLKQTVSGADGALNDMAETMLDNTKGSLIQLKSALEELALKIFDIMQPAIKGLIDAVRGFVGWLDQLNPTIQRTIVIIGGILAAIGPVLVIVGKLATGISGLVTAFGVLSAFVTTKLIPALSSISLTTVGVTAAVLGVAIVAYEVYRAWDEVKGALSATWEYLKAQANGLYLSIATSMQKMQVATIQAVDNMLEKLSILEKLPFGVGDSFKGLRDGVTSNVDASVNKLAELQKAAEDNAKRIAEATDGMKVAFGDLGQKIADDVQLAIGKITGATANAQELGTDTLESELDKQINAIDQFQFSYTEMVEDGEEERTEIISGEGDKQAQERERFESQWNKRLFDLSADRLAQLEREYDEAIAQAEKLEADKTDIEEWYAARRAQIKEEEQKIEQAKIDEKVRLILTWEKRLAESTATEEELLLLKAQNQIKAIQEQMAEELELAGEHGKARADIVAFWALEEEAIWEDYGKALVAIAERGLEERLALQEEWAEKAIRLNLDEAERRLRDIDQAEQAAIEIAKATIEDLEELEAVLTNIRAVYADERVQVTDNEQKRIQDVEEKAQSERLGLQEEWAEKILASQSSEMENRLRTTTQGEKQAIALVKERFGETEEAEELITAIVEYYEGLRADIREEFRKRDEELEAEKINRQIALEEEWSGKLLEITSTTKENSLRRIDEEEAAAIAKVKKEVENEEEAQKIIDDIIAYHAELREQIAQEEVDAKEAFEEEWNRRLFELSADRIEVLEREKERQIAAAKNAGQDWVLVEETYNKMIEQEEERHQKELTRIEQEEEDKRERQNQARLSFEQSWSDKVASLDTSPEARLEQLEVERARIIKQAEEMYEGVEGAHKAIEDIDAYYAKRRGEIELEIAENQKGFWERTMDSLKDPIETLRQSVATAAGSLLDVVGAISSGNWMGALATVLMETESFAKAMELIGAVLAPVVALFDLVLKPIINGILKLWNGIIDALASISIFGWKPFEGLKDKRIGLVGEGDESDTKEVGRGGRQVSEITGPTRDLLTDLLAPLAQFGQIVSPIRSMAQDVASINAKIPHYGDFALGGNQMVVAGTGGGGFNITIQNLNVTGTAGTVAEVGRLTLKEIERHIAQSFVSQRRGRGG